MRDGWFSLANRMNSKWEIDKDVAINSPPAKSMIQPNSRICWNTRKKAAPEKKKKLHSQICSGPVCGYFMTMNDIRATIAGPAAPNLYKNPRVSQNTV